MTTAIISSKTSVNHLTGDGHPEQPKRVAAITERLKKNKSLIWDKPTSFDENILKKAHGEDYVSMVKKSFPNQGLKFLDGDTIISPGSKDATIDAVGSVIKAVDGVEQKKFRNAFCVVRPPGHHAEKNKAMGFCIYNNCAVAAHYLIEKYKYKKIAIFDPDVHHGNGTQHIFESNPNVFYASSHQFPFYPGTGDISETGNGNIFNCPLPSGCDSILFRKLFTENILEKINHNFDLLYFSAGFDAHKLDPLASINLEDDDFKWITEVIIEKFASNIPIISVLEGGYDMKGLYNSLNHHLKVLQKYSNE